MENTDKGYYIERLDKSKLQDLHFLYAQVYGKEPPGIISRINSIRPTQGLNISGMWLTVRIISPLPTMA